MLSSRRSLSHLIGVFFLIQLLLGQQEGPRKKPVLIRDERTQEKLEAEPVAPDPQKAQDHVKVGDFYFKRDNYKAAEDRYRDAIKFNPTWPEPYEKLIRALEPQNSWLAAIEICEQFTESNPSSEQIEHFKEWGYRLKAQADHNAAEADSQSDAQRKRENDPTHFPR